MSTIRLRHGLASSAVLSNPVLALGEAGIETDTQKWKTGDGVTPWNSLPYMLGGSEVWGSITGTLSDQTDLQSALNAKQNSLGFTAENVANKDVDGTLAANSDTKYPSQKATKTYADTKQTALGFTPENVANKDVDGTLAANSDTKYASQKATKTYADTKQSALGFTPENVANKDTDGTLAANSDTKYPSQKAVKTYADALVIAAGAGDVVGPASAVGDDFVQFNSTTGKLIKDGGLSLDTNTSLGSSNVKVPSQNAVKSYVDAHAVSGTTSKVAGTDFTTTGTTSTGTDVTGLSYPAAASHLYEIDVILKVQSTTAAGLRVGVSFSAAGATGSLLCTGNSGTATQNSGAIAVGTTVCAANFAVVANTDCTITIRGMVTIGVNTGNITVIMSKTTSGTATAYIGSRMTVTQLS